MPAIATMLSAESSPCSKRRRAGNDPKAEGVLKAIKPRLIDKEAEFIRDLERNNAKQKLKLSREQEASIFEIYERFRENPELSKRISHIVVMANYRMIYQIALRIKKRYPIYRSSIEDLIAGGCKGAGTAVTKFDYKRGYKFCTYASWWIKHGIMDVFHNEERIVRIPVNATESLMKILKYSRDFEKRKKREPTSVEISKGTGMSIKKVMELLSMNPNAAMVELDVNEPDPDSERSFMSVALNETKDIIARCFAELDPREQFVIEKRFGLNGEEEQTLLEIGNKLGLSRERVRQIEEKSINKLKANPMIEGLSDH